jgi:hypothetical protein
VLSLFALTHAAEAQPARTAPGQYVDANGEVVDFAPMYESWFGPDRYRGNYPRAIVENAAAMAFEVAIYWYDPSINVVDWQFPDLDSKLSSSEAVRFDDNLLRTNYVFHPIAGSSHYLLTRVNGFGVPGSFLVSAASSASYELLFEWRELVSINDLIVTPFGGVAMGEFVHQLNNYLNSEPPTIRTELRANPGSAVRGAAKSTFGVFRHLHDELDRPPYPRRAPPDNLGLSSAYAHEFRLRAEQSLVDNDPGSTTELFGMAGEFEIVAMPGFLRPGSFSTWFTNGNFTEFDLRIGFNGRSRENEMFFDSHLFGWYTQNIEAARGGTRGHAFEAAIGSGLRYLDRRWTSQRDEYGIVHLPHPVQRSWLLLGPARLELELGVAPDFASVHSASYDQYLEENGPEGTKSSLKRHGYVHSWGGSFHAKAAVVLEAFELGSSFRFGHYESIDGVERAQDEVTRDTHGVERILDFRAHAQLEPPSSAVSARLEYRVTRRDSRLEPDYRARNIYRSLTVGTGLRF